MPARVRRPAHQAVERVDLAHQVALAEPADRRVARHLAEPVEAVRGERDARAHAVRRQRRLGAGVAAADDDHVDIAMFHVKQSYLPRQKLWNTTSSTASTSTLPEQEIKRAQRGADLLGGDLGARLRPRQLRRRPRRAPSRARSTASRCRACETVPAVAARSASAADTAASSRSIPAPVSPDTASAPSPPAGRPSPAPRCRPARRGTPSAATSLGPVDQEHPQVGRLGPRAAPARCRAPRSAPPASRRPAVSSRVSASPSRSSRTSITSRVVPATSEVSATSRPASAFSSVDLPTFGGPTSATSKPSRIRSAIAAAGELARPSPPRPGPSSARAAA